MRTLEEMIARVRRYANDRQAVEFDDDEITDYLRDAATVLWDDLAADTRSARLLRKVSAVQDFTPLVTAYALPEDCLQLLEVQVRHGNGERFIPVQFSDIDRHPEGALVRSSHAYLAGVPMNGSGNMLWCRGESGASVTIWPELAVVNGEQFKFVYVHAPLFPESPELTFNNPAEDGTVTELLPERVCEATEYYAAALLGSEDVEADRPMGRWGQLYRKTVDDLTRRGPVVENKAARFIRPGR